MPYLLLFIGLIVGAYALYRFFLRANVDEIKSFLFMAVTLVLCLALFLLAITGRLPAAIAIITAMWPIALGWWKMKHRKDEPGPPASGPMTRDEALDILGLKEGASPKDIKDAYKKLMNKVHPDHEGSEWMAAKLNQARDLLLEKPKRD